MLFTKLPMVLPSIQVPALTNLDTLFAGGDPLLKTVSPFAIIWVVPSGLMAGKWIVCHS
jgi:hypothetical protein